MECDEYRCLFDSFDLAGLSELLFHLLIFKYLNMNSLISKRVEHWVGNEVSRIFH